MPPIPDIATALDAPADALDADEQRFVNQIREHGWFRTEIFAEDNEPGFSFTTGFWVGHGFPEVIVFSLPREVTHDVLWNLYRLIESGNPPPIGVPTDTLFRGFNALLVPVDKSHYPDHLGWNRWFHGGDDFPCVQLFWPDKAGVFPGQAGAEASFKALQPDLSERAWTWPATTLNTPQG